MTAELITSNSLTILGTEIPVVSGMIHLTWAQRSELSSKLSEARNNFVDSLDFINNESVDIKDIGKINKFWFELNKIISDAWFDGISVADFQSRFSKSVENARA